MLLRGIFKKFQALSNENCEKNGVGNIVPQSDHHMDILREEEKVLKDLDIVINNAKIGLKYCESNPF